MLFTLYINDIVNIDSTVRYIIYADDTSLFLSHSDIDSLKLHADDVLHRLYIWSVKNCLVINSRKTKAVLFRAKNKPFTGVLELYLHNDAIELVKSFKSLGVFFQKHYHGMTKLGMLQTKYLKRLE